MPLVYPLLLYLLVRMLWIGLRRRDAGEHARRPLRAARPGQLAGDRGRLPARLSRRAERHELERHRRRLRGRDRRRPDRRRPRSSTATFPSDNAERRHVRAGRSTSPTCPFEQALTWSGQLGRPARRARRRDRASTCSPACCASSSGGACAGPISGSSLAYAWVAFPFTLYARCPTPTTRSSRRSCWPRCGRRRAAGRARRVARAGGADEVRAAGARAAVRDASAATRTRTIVSLRARLRAWPRRSAFAPVLAHNDLRSFWDASIAFQARARLAVLGLGAVRPGRVDRHVAARRAGRRGRCVPSALAFVPRRRDVVGLAALQRGDPDRAAARRHALVLPLHPVVLPARDARAAGALGRAVRVAARA